jgi:putative ABC transport system ATP-binding protein
MVVQPLFSFEDVRLVFQDTTVLDGITTTIDDEGVTVLAGPSGSGKSTLLRLCNRLDAPTSGTVRFRGDDVAELDPLRLRRRVGMVFQRPTLFPGTVRDNLLVAEPELSDRAARAALELVGLLPAFLDRTGDDLSGGEAQRACIARTLVTRPDALLMDEVTSALDPTHRIGIERLASRLADEGTPVVWVTHDLNQAARVASRTIVLDHGRIAEAGVAERFLAGHTGHTGHPADDEAEADDEERS